MVEEQAHKRTAREWFGIAMAGLLVFGLFWQLLGALGVVERPQKRKMYEYQGFDNNACLNRYQEKYRRADPSIPDATLFSDVARACVVERSEFEGWK